MCTRSSPTRTCPGRNATGWSTGISRCWPSTRCGTRGSPWPWWPPITRRRRVGPWNVSGWIMRCWSRSVMRVGPPWTPTVRRCTSRGRSPTDPSTIREGICCVISRSVPVPLPMRPGPPNVRVRCWSGCGTRRPWWCPPSTRWACRIRPSSARSRVWPYRPRTAVWICTWPHSGCTWTRVRSPRRWGWLRTRYG